MYTSDLKGPKLTATVLPVAVAIQYPPSKVVQWLDFEDSEQYCDFGKQVVSPFLLAGQKKLLLDYKAPIPV